MPSRSQLDWLDTLGRATTKRLDVETGSALDHDGAAYFEVGTLLAVWLLALHAPLFAARQSTPAVVCALQVVVTNADCQLVAATEVQRKELQASAAPRTGRMWLLTSR